MSAHGLALAIPPLPLPVLVALVGGHDDDGAHTLYLAHRLEQVHGTHDVRCIGADGVRVGRPDQRLGGHVDHDFRRRRPHAVQERLRIGHVTDLALDEVRYSPARC